MLDCGNSKHKHAKKERSRDCNASVASSASNDYPSRRCLERDVICDLIDSLRYSGRGGYRDERRCDRILDYIHHKRKSGHKSHETSRGGRCELGKNNDCIKFDGGNSSSTYAVGPIFDLGTSTPNLPEAIVQCHNDCPSPGDDDAKCSKCHC